MAIVNDLDLILMAMLGFYFMLKERSKKVKDYIMTIMEVVLERVENGFDV